MGVVNVTPDSFSDGGLFDSAVDAIGHGIDLVAHGADIVDVGGESTRPGSTSVTADEEIARTLPVVKALAAEGAVVSIDTSKEEVAAAAIEAGAEIVNDVTGLASAGMASICASSGVGVVLMHMQGMPKSMQVDPHYDDVVSDVAEGLRNRAAAATAAGVAADSICIDPGIGFGKTLGHNLDLLRNLTALSDGPYPVLVGPSRKGFLGSILESHGRTSSPRDRDVATGAVIAIAIWQGVAAIRVHDVEAAADVARTADAIVRTGHMNA